MGLFRVVKKGVASGLNFKRMLGTDRLVDDTKYIKKLFNHATQRSGSESQAGTAPRDFAEAMRVYKVDEKGLQERIRKAKQICLVYLAISIPLFFYTFFLWYRGLIAGGLMSLVLVMVLLVFAFRESFNLYQMKQRRLGCSVKEWFNDLVKGSK